MKVERIGRVSADVVNTAAGFPRFRLIVHQTQTDHRRQRVEIKVFDSHVDRVITSHWWIERLPRPEGETE